MTIKDINDYVNSLDPSLSKFEFKSENDGEGNLYVTQTKETYLIEDGEQAADRMINDARLNPDFAGVKKEYKPGKVNKSGEITKNEAWKVEITYKF